MCAWLCEFCLTCLASLLLLLLLLMRMEVAGQAPDMMVDMPRQNTSQPATNAKGQHKFALRVIMRNDLINIQIKDYIEIVTTCEEIRGLKLKMTKSSPRLPLTGNYLLHDT